MDFSTILYVHKNENSKELERTRNFRLVFTLENRFEIHKVNSIIKVKRALVLEFVVIGIIRIGIKYIAVLSKIKGWS